MGSIQYNANESSDNYNHTLNRNIDSNHISESCKKEYFSLAKKNINNSLKKVKSTFLNSQDSLESNNEPWGYFLVEKLKYFHKQKQDKQYLLDIIQFVDSFQETNESKHIYNLSIFLAQELDEHSYQKLRSSSIIDKFLFEEKNLFENELGNDLSLSKEEIFWRGTEFIICDLESFEHPLYRIIKAINMYTSDYYERVFNGIKNKILLENKIKSIENSSSFSL